MVCVFHICAMKRPIYTPKDFIYFRIKKGGIVFVQSRLR